MIAWLGRLINQVLRRTGYEIRRFDADVLGVDPFRDIQRLVRLEGKGTPITILDVGANEGQSIERFRNVFDHPRLHAFEPGTKAHDQLRTRFSGSTEIVLNNFALGSTSGHRVFHESDLTDMSSFLNTGREGWGKVRKDSTVRIETVDAYCDSAGISHIDVLKSDTQGFDLEVLKGAERMLRGGNVQLILVELTLAEIYQGIPSLDMVYRHLYDRKYRLVTFYPFHYISERAGWTDALFAYSPGSGPQS